MAVEKEQKQRDMYEAHLGDDDERVEVDGWVYYVRAVKRERDLTHGYDTAGLVVLFDVVGLFLAGFRRLLGRRKPWIVGVVRMGSVSTWNNMSPQVVHRETAPRNVSPRSRIAELMVRVRAGEFSPTEDSRG